MKSGARAVHVGGVRTTSTAEPPATSAEPAIRAPSRSMCGGRKLWFVCKATLPIGPDNAPGRWRGNEERDALADAKTLWWGAL